MLRIITMIDNLAVRWLDWTLKLEKEKFMNSPEGKKVDEETKLLSLTQGVGKKRGSAGVRVMSPAVGNMVAVFATMLMEQECQSYMEFDLMPRLDRGLPDILVTVQYKKGLRPATRATYFEKALATAVSLHPDTLMEIVPWVAVDPRNWDDDILDLSPLVEKVANE